MISLNRQAGALANQIYEYHREAILQGTLNAGDRLPASRTLADELLVSRNTIVRAYDRLIAEGFAYPVHGAGLFVARIEGLARTKNRRKSATGKVETSTLSKRVAAIPRGFIERTPKRGVRYEFLYGEASFEDFPVELWARTLGKVARRIQAKHLSYPDFRGLDELRTSIAGYLARARGIACDAANIMIVHGTQEAIELSFRLLIDAHDPVVCETPFYRGFMKVAKAYDAAVHFAGVDDEGLITRQLPSMGKLAFVTPSHQFPTGGIMSINRRLELLTWAKRSEALILEDDYDGEFRYSSAPVASLKSLDDSGRVIYVGTVSKTFFPALRLGWMVVPDALTDPLKDLRALSDTTPPAMEQLALAEFIEEGQFERHIFRTRKRYAEKRRRLLDVLDRTLGDRVRIRGEDAGIHILLTVPELPRARTDELQSRCLGRGVSVNSSSQFYNEPPDTVELVIGYNAVPANDIEAGATIIAEEILAMAG